ncbi:hypothetical protein C0993_004018 [Termitomyces sp. T159_Od127]|nr:hypothetical protein C0993_004018 [Termitomyces sp. T159_Od127]
MPDMQQVSRAPSFADKNASNQDVSLHLDLTRNDYISKHRGSNPYSDIWQSGRSKFTKEQLPAPQLTPVLLDGTYNPFPNYVFTGSIRPVYPLSKTRVVPDHIPRPDYAADGKPVSEARRAGQPPRLLTLEEQDKMRRSCRLAREVLDLAASHVRPGITTDELDEIVHNATIERNAYPSPLNYRNFPKSVCTYVNIFSAASEAK